MSIQQNINQTMSVASFLAAQSPMAVARREKQAAAAAEKREDERITKAYKSAKDMYDISSPGTDEHELEMFAHRGKQLEEAAAAYEKRFLGREIGDDMTSVVDAGSDVYIAKSEVAEARENYEIRQAEKQAEDDRITEMVEEDERIEREREREKALVEGKRAEAANRPTTDYMTPEGRTALLSARESAAARAKEDRIAAYKVELERLTKSKGGNR